MESKEKIERLMQDDWEIHGDPKQLCLLLRDEIKRIKSESVELAIRRLNATQAVRDDQNVCLQGRYEASIEANVWERVGFLLGRV